jgi:hypothetical protein
MERQNHDLGRSANRQPPHLYRFVKFRLGFLSRRACLRRAGAPERALQRISARIEGLSKAIAREEAAVLPPQRETEHAASVAGMIDLGQVFGRLFEHLVSHGQG